MEQNFFDSDAHFNSDAGLSLKQKWRSVPSPGSATENGSFECNICLDSASEPVVTLCGHLYCWPCIYKWLQVQTDSIDEQNCPVCKAAISHASLVPLYGRGSADQEKADPGLVIPRRPIPSPRNQHTNFSHSTSPRTFQYFPHQYGTGPVTTTSLFNPAVGVFGEMVFTRMFGSQTGNLFPYASPAGGGGSPRLRRQEVQLDKSLNRVSIFMFCCIILCLLLF